MSQFLICESKDLSNYGVRLSGIKSNKEFYDRVVDQYMKDANTDHIWVIEKMLDMVDQLEENIHVIDEISRQSELMIFWYGSDFRDLDKIDTRESLMDYLKQIISNPCPEIYLYVDLKHSNFMSEGDRKDFFKRWRSELIKSGIYSPVALDMTQKELKEIFGEESDYSKVRTKNGIPRILKYDDIEFHFTDDDIPKLYLIYSDETYDIAIQKYKCLCCGYRTLATRAEFEICHVCFWEDDVYMIINEKSHKISSLYYENYITENDEEKLLDIPSEANHGLTLREGRKNYKLFGACDKDMIKYVRKPRKEELLS